MRFTGITGSSDGLKLAVVVIDGYIYTSADGGATWTQRDPAGGVRSWGSITSSPDGVYLTATITNGSIWTSTDSGVTWTERTFPTTYDWRACCMTSNGQKIYAAPFIAYPTGQNFLQESTNGGSTWIQVDQPGNGGYGITTTGTTRFATSSNGNTFMLTTGSVVYTSTDAGSTFVRRNLPLTVGTSPNVQFLNNITCDATGQIIYVAPAGLVSGVIQKSVDGGANWTGLTASGSRNWSFIRCSSNGQYIYGAIGSGNSTIYISTDSGNTFTSVVLPTTGASIRGIECDTTGQTVYVTISNTTLFKSTNYGATWSSASTLVAIGAAIDCNSTGSSILARNTSTSVTDYLYISTDSGATFNPITSAGQKLWSAASISGDGTRLVAATSAVINASNVVTSPGSVWVSKDSGATWEEQTSIPTNERWSGLQISSDGSKIYASGVSMQMYKASV
jgi:hypothetical protein